jgi:DNA-directed RNA polymerase subunit N
LGHLWEEYSKKVKDGKDPAEVLDSLDIERYCCRRMFLGHVEVMDKIVKYRKY